MRNETLPAPDSQCVSVDAHTHIFCWGEDPADGFVSARRRGSWRTRTLLRWTGVMREPGETITTKLRHRLLRHLRQSSLDYAVVLAQDALYDADGRRDDSATEWYVSNDYVLRLAGEAPGVLAGCSINPLRADALPELSRCHAAGARLVKIHTSIHGVDPALPRFDPFYRLAADLGVVLMFHTGYEHTGTVLAQHFADPARLARPLDHGGTVIAAHCGTCAFYDPEDYYPSFIRLLGRYANLYGDTSVMAGFNRWASLKHLSRESAAVRARLVHGSDYPFPPSRLPHLRRTGLFPTARRNPLELDLAIKRSYRFGPGYESRILRLMGVPCDGAPGQRTDATG